MEPTTRLTAASGHQISIVGCFKFHLWFLGRAVMRPIYVVDGLSKSSAIFGIDVIREQQLMVSGEDVFFKDIAEDKWASLSTLTVPSELCVPARTIMKVNVQARDCLLYTSPSPRDS